MNESKKVGLTTHSLSPPHPPILSPGPAFGVRRTRLFMIEHLHHRWRQRRLRLFLDGGGIPYDVSFLLYEQLSVFGCVEPNPGWPTRHEESMRQAEYSSDGGEEISKHTTKVEKSRYVRDFWEPVLSLARA